MPFDLAWIAHRPVERGTMADNLDVLNTAVSLLVRAALLAARFPSPILRYDLLVGDILPVVHLLPGLFKSPTSLWCKFALIFQHAPHAVQFVLQLLYVLVNCLKRNFPFSSPRYGNTAAFLCVSLGRSSSIVLSQGELGCLP